MDKQIDNNTKSPFTGGPVLLKILKFKTSAKNDTLFMYVIMNVKKQASSLQQKSRTNNFVMSCTTNIVYAMGYHFLMK